MLDIKFIRDNAEFVKTATKNKGFDETVVAKLLEVDVERRKLIGFTEEIRAKKNKLTKDDIEEGKKLKVELKEVEERLKSTEILFNDLMLKVPNISDKDVKVGTEEDNEVIKKVGTPKEFEFNAVPPEKEGIKFLLEKAVRLFLVTETGPYTAPGGTDVVIWVDEADKTLALTAPKEIMFSLGTPLNPVPVIVITVPILPVNGDTEVIVGGGNT